MSLLQKVNNKIILSDSAVFHCGCGGVVPSVRNKLVRANAPWVGMITTYANKKAMDYLRQNGYLAAVPSLKKSSHAVLINPKTGKYIDLAKAPSNETVFKNIYKVATGG